MSESKICYLMELPATLCCAVQHWQQETKPSKPSLTRPRTSTECIKLAPVGLESKSRPSSPVCSLPGYNNILASIGAFRNYGHIPVDLGPRPRLHYTTRRHHRCLLGLRCGSGGEGDVSHGLGQ